MEKWRLELEQASWTIGVLNNRLHREYNKKIERAWVPETTVLHTGLDYLSLDYYERQMCLLFMPLLFRSSVTLRCLHDAHTERGVKTSLNQEHDISPGSSISYFLSELEK